jgi:ribosomal protein L29
MHCICQDLVPELMDGMGVAVAPSTPACAEPLQRDILSSLGFGNEQLAAWAVWAEESQPAEHDTYNQSLTPPQDLRQETDEALEEMSKDLQLELAALREELGIAEAKWQAVNDEQARRASSSSSSA